MFQEKKLIDLLNFKDKHLCKSQPTTVPVHFDLQPIEPKEKYWIEIKTTLKIGRVVHRGKRKGRAVLPPSDVFLEDDYPIISFDPTGVSVKF